MKISSVAYERNLCCVWKTLICRHLNGNLPPLYHNLPPNLREMAANQDLTPIAHTPFILYKQSLHPYPPQFSPITDASNPVLPNHSPSITKWLRRYRQTNAFCCFRCCETWSFGDFEDLLPNSQSPHLQEVKAILLHSHAHSPNATVVQRAARALPP